MKKTLIIIAHPNLKESICNKRWLNELNKYQEKYQVHNLYNIYPDEKIEVEKEQKLIESYDKIIFQFPFYWFSSPPLLKKWFDEVLTYGWAYGSKSKYKFSDKKVGLAISVGGEEQMYTPEKYGYTLQELINPFKLTFNIIKADYKSAYVYYDIGQDVSDKWIENSIPGYLSFIESI